ncbi:MAG: SRPBCC family protein [Thermoleophilia bacterium]
MADVTTRVTIARPPAEVFAALCDVESLPRWQGSALSVRRETPAPTALGARWSERRRFMGKENDAHVEVIGFEPDRLLVIRIRSGPVSLRVRHALAPAGAGCELVVEAGDAEGIPRLMRSAAVRMAGREARDDFARLKRLLEAAPR